MDKSIEEKLKAAQAEKEYAAKCDHGRTTGTAPGAQLGGQACEAKIEREGFTDRFRRKLWHAEREQRRTAHIQELVYLLDKNPDVARILELVQLTEEW